MTRVIFALVEFQILYFLSETAAARIISKRPTYFISVSLCTVVPLRRPNAHQNLEKPFFKAFLAATKHS